MTVLANIHEQMKENHRADNLAIVDRRMTQMDERIGARVGDWLEFADGRTCRIAHHWGDSVQPASGKGDTGSFYLGDGYASYSGSLEPSISLELLKNTGKSRQGSVWIFDRDYHRAGGAVYFTPEFRVFKVGSK